MGNKLRNVFSKEEITFGEKINFNNQEAYEKFMMALDTVQEEGKTVKIEGVYSVETLIRNGKSEYPIKESGNICDFIVAPSTDEVSFEMDTDYGQKQLVLKRYWINKGIVLQTSQDATIYLKIFLEKYTMKSEVNYRIQLENAKNVEELIESYSIVLTFFNRIFRENVEKSENGITIENIKKYFEKSIETYEKLKFVEREFGITFEPKTLTQNKESWMDLEELYFVLKEKEVIRLNVKAKDTGTTRMKVNRQIENIKIGDALDITFVMKMSYSLWNINITLFAANLLSNAIVKEIREAEDSEIKILYGSEDSRPMYISYMGFKTEEEAKEEMKKIMNHKDDYTNALTVMGHINKRQSEEK